MLERTPLTFEATYMGEDVCIAADIWLYQSISDSLELELELLFSRGIEIEVDDARVENDAEDTRRELLVLLPSREAIESPRNLGAVLLRESLRCDACCISRNSFDLAALSSCIRCSRSVSSRPSGATVTTQAVESDLWSGTPWWPAPRPQLPPRAAGAGVAGVAGSSTATRDFLPTRARLLRSLPFLRRGLQSFLKPTAKSS